MTVNGIPKPIPILAEELSPSEGLLAAPAVASDVAEYEELELGNAMLGMDVTAVGPLVAMGIGVVVE